MTVGGLESGETGEHVEALLVLDTTDARVLQTSTLPERQSGGDPCVIRSLGDLDDDGIDDLDEILGLEDFQLLPVELGVTTEDGSLGERGRVTDLLKPSSGDEVFACGPTGMMKRAYELARAGSARCWVSLETHMACGFGICLGCVVPVRGGYRYVCTDGPVFEAADLDWEAVA